MNGADRPVFLAALSGLYILNAGLESIGVAKPMRLPLLGAITVGSLALYTFLSILFGISSHILLYMIGG
ncbi:MAG: hypothetical protein R3C68_09530 [Myxococcota bacterium]